MTQTIPYLFQRSNSKNLNFRMTIPKDLQGHEGLPKGTHIQYSLKTDDAVLAGKLAQAEAEKWQKQFDALRSPVRCDGVLELGDYIKELAQTGSRADIEMFTDGLDDICHDIDRWLHADTIMPLEKLNASLERNHRLRLSTADHLLGTDGEPTQKEKRDALKLMLYQILTLWDILKVELGVPSTARRFADLVPSTEGIRTVKDVLERIDKRGERSEATANNIKRHIKMFVAYTTATPFDPKGDGNLMYDINAVLTDEHVEGFKKHLLQESKLAIQTVHNIWSSLSLFARTAHTAGWVDKNPVDGIKLPPVGKGTGKRAFTLDELTAIKEKVQEAGNHHALATKIAMWTGARQGEVTQSYGKDFDLAKGFWRIHADRDDMKLKTEPSERLLCLHSELLNDKQFVEAVEEAQRTGRRVVTPAISLSKDQGYSKPLSKWFTKLKRDCGFGGELDFHSLRRAWITQADLQGVDKDVAQLYTGHRRTGVSAVHDGYVSERDLLKWKKEIEKLKL